MLNQTLHALCATHLLIVQSLDFLSKRTPSLPINGRLSTTWHDRIIQPKRESEQLFAGTTLRRTELGFKPMVYHQLKRSFEAF